MKAKELKTEKIVPLTLFSVTLFISPISSYDPINLIKLICLLVGGTLSFWAILQNRNLLKTKADLIFLIPICLFMVWRILSYFLSGVSNLDGLYGVFGRNNGLLTSISLALICIYAAQISNNRTTTSTINTLVLCGGLSAVYGLIQSLGLDPFDWTTAYTPVFGFLGNPNFHSSFMAMTAATSLLLILQHKNNQKKLFYLALGMLSLYNINKTESQQGFVVFSIITFFGVYLLFRRRVQSYIFDLLVLSLSFLSLCAITLDLLQKAPWSSFLYENSITFRGDFWRAGISMAVKNPVWGVGPDGYRDNYMRYRDFAAATRPGADQITDSAHNYFIEIASTGGLPLFILYSLIQILLLVRVFIKIKNKTISYDFIIIFIIWLGFSIQSLISIGNLGLQVWGWALTGYLIGYKTGNKLNDNFQVKFSSPTPYILVILSLILTIPKFSNDVKFRTSVEKSDVKGVLDSALNWPQDVHRMNYVSKIFRESGLEKEAVEVARAAVKINPQNVEVWRELSLLSNTIESEKRLAKKNIIKLDPLGK
jgi:O-antigen ligase